METVDKIGNGNSRYNRKWKQQIQSEMETVDTIGKMETEDTIGNGNRRYNRKWKQKMQMEK
ncbi:hypothetical protein [Methanolapillus millepedarum]|uniref:hypothetical protein n=1 Tax=Methanolapillus millepedarum TaxID=3028296 RepID=UPI0030B8CA0C